MRPAILIAAALLAACGGREAEEPERFDCSPVPELAGNSSISVRVQRRDGALVWTDTKGIDHHITEADSWAWDCTPHHED